MTTDMNYNIIETFINKSWESFNEIIHSLNNNNNISLIDNVGKVYRTTLTIEAAAYCEARMVCELRKIYYDGTGSDTLANFVYRSALERKFHTLFQWNEWEEGKGWKDKKGANFFYSMFGPDFKKHMKVKTENLEFKGWQDAFIELISTRNRFAHMGSSEHTHYSASDAFDKFNKAKTFLEMFFEELMCYIKKVNENEERV